MQDYVTPFSLSLVVAANAACALALVIVLLTPSTAKPGWHAVRPSGLHWFCFLGCWALGALISWVWMYVGSGRLDAEFQMRVAYGLALLFCVGATWAGFHTAWLKRTAIQWRESDVSWRDGGLDIQQNAAGITGYKQGWDSYILIGFRDESTLKLDPYAEGATALLNALFPGPLEDEEEF